MTDSCSCIRLANRKMLSLPAGIAFLLLTIAFAPQGMVAQSNVPVVTGNARVDKLLSEMTLAEKMALIRGAYEPAATNQGQAAT